MTKEEKLRILIDSYNDLRFEGTIKNWGDYANFIGISRSNISSAKNGDERCLTDSLIERIQAYMSRRGHKPQFIDKSTTSITPDSAMVPTIPYSAYKETGLDLHSYLSDSPDHIHMTPRVAQFAHTDCHCFVESDAMLPFLRPTDVLALRRVPEFGQIINGEIYVVNSKTTGLITRFVYDEGDTVVLKASSEQPRYTDIRMKKADVFNFYRILGLIRTNI